MGFNPIKAVKKAANAVGNAAKDVGNAVGNAAKDVGKAVSGAAKEVKKVVVGGVEAIESGGKIIINALEDAGKGLVKLIEDKIIGVRGLRDAEKALAKRVYANSLPLGRVAIISLSGLQGRPFTIPGSLLTSVTLAPLKPILALPFLVSLLQEHYLIFFGRAGYNDGLNGRKVRVAGDVLIHELAHVWQGHNEAFTWKYVLDSVYNQVRHGDKAYEYVPGKTWSSYAAEQQAEIIEDWFANGEKTGDPLFPYIRDNVRPGKPRAKTNLATTSALVTTRLTPVTPVSRAPMVARHLPLSLGKSLS